MIRLPPAILLTALLLASGTAAGAPPEVRILAPGPERAVVGPTVFEAEVRTGPGISVARVEMWVDGHSVAVLNRPPWRTTFDAGPALRPHTLRVVATDGAGESGSALGTTLYIGFVEEVTVVGRAALQAAFPVGVLDRRGDPQTALAADAFRVDVGGRPALVLTAALDTRPLAVEVLLDISGSLLPLWSQTREAVRRFLAGLASEDGSEVLIFAGSLHRLSPFGQDHADAARRLSWLETGAPQGFDGRGTRLYDALAAGIEEINVRDGQRSLLVLTDTFDSGSHLSWTALEPVVRQAGLRLDVVRFGRPQAGRWSHDHRMVVRISKLAEASGGRVWRVRDPEDIPTIFADLARELKSRYRLVAAPAETTGSGLQSLRVRVPGGKARVLAPGSVRVRLPPSEEPSSR